MRVKNPLWPKDRIKNDPEGYKKYRSQQSKDWYHNNPDVRERKIQKVRERRANFTPEQHDEYRKNQNLRFAADSKVSDETGICIKCKVRPRDVKSRYCVYCRPVVNERSKDCMKALRKSRENAGLCNKCGLRPPTFSKFFPGKLNKKCDECSEEARRRAIKYS